MSNQPASKSKTVTKTTKYSAALRKLGYSFQLNEVTGRDEVNFTPLTDNLMRKIRAQMIDEGLPSDKILDAAIGKEAYDNKYHPVKKYLTGLSYDGKDYFSQLVSCFTNADGLFPVWLRKWMIGAVAKVVECAQNPMLILDGPQGIGKSQFVKWLCSGIPGYFVEGALDADSKDHLGRLASKWIWEVGELETTMRRADRGALKNFITTAEITVRLAYGKYELSRPAIANMVGTVNNINGILDDPTGNRRFLICHIEDIDWQEYIKLNVNDVWAQIYAAYLTGETWKLSESERATSEKNNQEYQLEDPIENALKENFRIDPSQAIWWTSTNELTTYLQDHGIKFPTSRAMQMELASTCKRIGLLPKKIRIQGQEIRGYAGIKDMMVP
jgi:predicted P-loop ATPase